MASGSLDGGRDTYLSLGQADSVSNGWQTPHDNASVTGKPLEIGRIRFHQGIGMHAPAELTYTLTESTSGSPFTPASVPR